MTALVAVLVLAGVLLLRPPRTDRRLRRVLGEHPPPGTAPDRPATGRAGRGPSLMPATGRPAVRWAAAVAGGGGVALLLGGAVGASVGLLVAVTAVRALPRLAGRADDARRLAEDLPLVADLLAAGVSAGLEVGAAAAAVAAAVEGPWGAALSRAVALHRLGADPAHAWGGLGQRAAVRRQAAASDGEPTEPSGRSSPAAGAGAPGPDPRPPEVAAFARSMARAVAGGAPLADSLARLAGEVRQAQRAAAQEAAHRAGVRMVGPLVVCALPAFVLVGVVPAVAGLAAGALGQLR